MKKNFLFLFLYIQFAVFASENIEKNKLKILVGSPVHQKTSILKEFLESFKRLDKDSFTLDYFFIDDNDNEESSKLLNDFKNDTNCLIISTKNDLKYDQDKNKWNEQFIKAANFKDQMIQKACSDNYDYLFIINSDIVLHPKTLEHLIKTKKNIISNIYWTINISNKKLLPQVWISDFNMKYPKKRLENPSEEEINKRTDNFLNMLKHPGTYEVGGLEGCTLISKAALNKGLSFKKLSNVSMPGEDRHFCIRAIALGLSLFVDTHFPAYHINKNSDLKEVEYFVKKHEIKEPKITLSMVIKNEAHRYLREVLEKAKEYISDAVIIDDASSDNTPEICLEVLKGIPFRLIVNNSSRFINEVNLRRQQWEETIKTNPDWILLLDADEILEDKFKDKIKDLIISKEFDAYCFRLYDFWNETHYRDDYYWKGSRHYYMRLIRYIPDIEYKWHELAQHCGGFPKTIQHFKKCCTDLRLKHFGWSRYEDRIAKYQRYKRLDPDSRFGWKEQYDSILDVNPNLVLWKE